MWEKESELISALERLNAEYLELKESKEYKLGNKIISDINLIMKGNFIKLAKNYKNRFNNKKCKYLNDASNCKTNNNCSTNSTNKYKIAIYTCVLGNYDIVKDPIFKNREIDYFIFTDNENFNKEIWCRKDIPNSVLKLKNNTKINRYIKLHPQEFFSDYDYTIYIDGNVRIISDMMTMVENANSKVGIAMHKHSLRNCIFKEAKACKLLGKGNAENLDRQIKRYKSFGFEEKFGLFEANMIISNMKNENCRVIFKEWWNEFCNSESLRDQIAFPYVLWKCGYKQSDVGCLGNNIYKNPKLQVNRHK